MNLEIKYYEHTEKAFYDLQRKGNQSGPKGQLGKVFSKSGLSHTCQEGRHEVVFPLVCVWWNIADCPSAKKIGIQYSSLRHKGEKDTEDS